MTNPANSAVQNLLPVQAYFNVDGSFNTFIGQGVPFYATSNPIQSGLTITNSTLNSSPIGGTSPSTGAFTNIATTTGTISTNASSATDIVNLLTLQSYAAGISWKNPVTAATTTNITLSGLQTVDTVSLVAGNTVLVKNQTDNTKNGIYQVNAGAWTYATGCTTWAQYVSALVFVEYGTQAGSAWYCTAQPGGTLGTTAMVWSNFSVASTYTAGTGLTLAGYQFSITNTGVAANTYGSATASPVFAVNAQGQITSVTNTTITPAIGNVTGLATGIATFLQTPTSANLAAAVSDETGSGSLVFATSPTLVTPALGTPASGVMTNVTGLPLTTGVTGTLAIGNGGTGQTTASAAFNALSPITTAGDLIIGNGTNSATRLAIGANATVLTSNGTTASWASLPAGMVYPGAGIANSTGSAWGTSYSTTGSGSVVALATSPSFTTPSLGVASATSLAVTAAALTSSNTSSLGVGGNLGFSDTGIISHAVASTNGYLQQVIQNTNAGASASAEFIAYNNSGTASTNYACVGINSSGYTGTGSINAAGYGYFLTGSTDLVIGTIGANSVHITTNSQATDAITVNTSNAVAFNGQYGTAGYLLQSNGSGTANSWVNPATLTVSAASTATSATTATTATNATNTAITDDTTTASAVYPTWVTTTSGNQAQKTTSTRLSFVPSTGALSATSFSGAGTGLTGTAASLTAGNATTAAAVTGGYVSSIVAGTGISVSGATGAVTVSASGAYAGPGGQVFANSGTFTIPSGITKLKVTVTGGGGGAAGASGVHAGGGGGGTAIKWLTGLTSGANLAVTIGGGGNGGIWNNGGQTSGNAGGNSTVASGNQSISTITGGGGGGGVVNMGTGNRGGVGSGGDLNMYGDPGPIGPDGSGLQGGSSYFGGGAAGTNGTSQSGNAYGGGGGCGGGSFGQNSAAGASGVVVFEW